MEKGKVELGGEQTTGIIRNNHLVNNEYYE